jgi:hypothetical protein
MGGIGYWIWSIGRAFLPFAHALLPLFVYQTSILWHFRRYSCVLSYDHIDHSLAHIRARYYIQKGGFRGRLIHII